MRGKYYFLAILGLCWNVCWMASVNVKPHEPASNLGSHGNNTDHHGLKENGTHSENETEHEAGEHDMEGHTGIHIVSLRYDYVRQPLIIGLFIFAAGVAKLAFHHAHFLSSRVPESCLLIILGIIVGAIMSKAVPARESSPLPGLSSTLFFLYLLPPIILESAYSLHDRTFYENVGSVIIFAVIGTVLNCFMIGPALYGLAEAGAMGEIHIDIKQCLVFSAIIVAVDPVAVLAIFQEIGVNNVLYFLVFGESLFNDAVTVVLYNMMNEFNNMEHVAVTEVIKGLISFFVVSLGGLTVGIFHGVLTAFITKYTGTVRVVEPLAVFSLAYISYLAAELFHFSGIISIICCGLTQAQYAFHNISQKSHTTIKYFSKMQSSTSDCIIFLFLGIAVFTQDIMEPSNWHIGFIMWTLLLCLIFRFIVVFCLTYLVNRSSRMRRINKEEQFIMAYGGLRGAVAFSLVDLLESDNLPRSMFLTTTLTVIFFTVFVQGITIKPLVKLLRVKLQEEKELKISEEINSHVTDHVMAGIEEVLGTHGEHYFREVLEYYDRKYIKKWLMKDPISMDEQIMSCFEEIALQQHFEHLAGSKMIQEKYGSLDESRFAFIHHKLQESIMEVPDEEEQESGDETVLPAITIRSPSIVPPAPMNKYPDLMDDELKLIQQSVAMRRQTLANTKRKSMFPGFSKRRDSKTSTDEPSAHELRNMFTPSRRQVQHRKLDKNLKDESSTDLLRYLQEKQMRTRRMSRAIAFKDSTTNSPTGSNLQLNTPPRGIDANTVVQNYRRRLSLAVPERPKFQRDRSPSDISDLRSARFGDAKKSPETSPSRKRRGFFKKAHTFQADDHESDPLMKNKSSPVATSSPTSRPKKKKQFEAISEHDEEGSPGLDDTLSTASTVSSGSSKSKSSHKRRPKLQRAKTVDVETPSDKVNIGDPTDNKKEKAKVTFEKASEKKKKSSPKKKFLKSKSLDSPKFTLEPDEDDPENIPSSPDTIGVPEHIELRKSSYTQAVSTGAMDDSPSNKLEVKDIHVSSRSDRKHSL